MAGPMTPARRASFALASLVAACLGVSCGRGSVARVDEGRRVASSFLDEVRAGRTEPAWKGTTVEFKSLMGADALRDLARNQPALKGTAEYVDSRPIDSGHLNLVEYRFRGAPTPPRKPSKSPPAPKTIRVLVSFEEDPPKVERLAVD